MNRQSPNLILFLDFFVVLASGYLAYLVRSGDAAPSEHYQLAIIIAGFITVGIFSFTHLYLSAVTSLADNARRVFFPLVASWLVIAGLAYLSKSSEHFSRIWAALWFGFCYAGMVGLRAWLAHAGRSASFKQWAGRRLVLIGRGADILAQYRQLQSQDTPWLVVTGLFVAEGPPPEGVSGEVATGTTEDLLTWAREHPVDDLLVVPPTDEDGDYLLRWLKPLHLVPANLHVGPLPLLQIYPDAKRLDLAGLPVINAVRHPLTSVNRVLKLLADMGLAILLLIPGLPLMALIALAIRLDSPGPVLFRQQRYGFHNQVFTVYKFRSMTPEETPDPDLPQARREDPRVTRVGRLLRRFSLDELPQLFNVLNGSMSLVGPRPHAVPHNDKYARLLDSYLERHKVKPGITGWAQVNGLRGETDTLDKMHRRVEADLYYVKNWSPLLDLEILLRTVLVVVSGRNAY